MGRNSQQLKWLLWRDIAGGNVFYLLMYQKALIRGLELPGSWIVVPTATTSDSTKEQLNVVLAELVSEKILQWPWNAVCASNKRVK